MGPSKPGPGLSDSLTSRMFPRRAPCPNTQIVLLFQPGKLCADEELFVGKWLGQGDAAHESTHAAAAPPSSAPGGRRIPPSASTLPFARPLRTSVDTFRARRRLQSAHGDCTGGPAASEPGSGLVANLKPPSLSPRGQSGGARPPVDALRGHSGSLRAPLRGRAALSAAPCRRLSMCCCGSGLR
jgi:hypothetical protein